MMLFIREWTLVHSLMYCCIVNKKIKKESGKLTNKDRIEKLTENLLESIMDTHQIELVDIEYVKELGNYYLRIYIDKEGGITINDCEVVSKGLEAQLDEKDPIVEAYILEVSSPGLDRPLKKDKDFKRSLGKDIEFKLYTALKGQKEFVGTLISYTKTEIVVKINDEEKTFDRSALALIRLSIVF